MADDTTLAAAPPPEPAAAPPAGKQRVNLPDGGIAYFPADWTSGMIQSKLWDTFPQWRPKGPIEVQGGTMGPPGYNAPITFDSYEAYQDALKRRDARVANQGQPQGPELPPTQLTTRLPSPPLAQRTNLTPQQQSLLAEQTAARGEIGPVTEAFLPGGFVERALVPEPSPEMGAALASPMGMHVRPFVQAPGPTSEFIHAAGRTVPAMASGITAPENIPAVVAATANPLAASAVGLYYGGQGLYQGTKAFIEGQAVGDVSKMGTGAGQALIGATILAPSAAVALAPRTLAAAQARYNEAGRALVETVRPVVTPREGLAGVPEPGPVTTPEAARLAPSPLARLGTGIAAVENAASNVAESGTVPHAATNRALNNLKDQLEAGRRAARLAGQRTAAAGAQPAAAAAGAMGTGAAAPGAAADAALATALKAIQDAYAAVLRAQAGVVDAQQAARALSAAASAAGDYHKLLGDILPKEIAPPAAAAPIVQTAYTRLSVDEKLEALAQKAADPAAGRFNPQEIQFLNQVNRDPVLQQRFVARQAELKAAQPTAAPAAPTPGVPNASSQQETAGVHGNLQPQPVEGEGQVPVAQSGGGVQSQATGGVREQAPVATSLEQIRQTLAATAPLDRRMVELSQEMVDITGRTARGENTPADTQRAQEIRTEVEGIHRQIQAIHQQQAPVAAPVVAPAAPVYKATVYQGRGASLEDIYGPDAVREGRASPLLGKADYFATNPEDAKIYGTVTEHTVELHNPLKIDSDNAWLSLLNDADALVLNSRGREWYEHPERIVPATEKVQAYLRSKGYDGVIVDIPEHGDMNARGERIKGLVESFGHSQVIRFPGAEAPKAAVAPTAPAPEAPKPAPAIQELRMEGVTQADAEALLAGTKTVKEVVEGNFKVTPAWTVAPDAQGHAEAWMAGYNQAIERLTDIVSRHQKPAPAPAATPTLQSTPSAYLTSTPLPELARVKGTPFEGTIADVNLAGETPENLLQRFNYRQLIDLSKLEGITTGKTGGLTIGNLAQDIITQHNLVDRVRATLADLPNQSPEQLRALYADLPHPFSAEFLGRAPQEKVRADLQNRLDIYNEARAIQMGRLKHKLVVEKALDAGQTVPPEVLRHYPDLAKQYGLEPLKPEPFKVPPDQNAEPTRLSAEDARTSRISPEEYKATMEALSKLEGESKPAPVLSHAEITHLLDYTRTRAESGSPIALRDDALVNLMYSSGLRKTEARLIVDPRIHWPTADQPGWLDIAKETAKYGKRRLVPLAPQAVDALSRYMSVGRPLLRESNTPPGMVFLTRSGGEMSPVDVWRTIKGIGEKAGLPSKIWPHILRHTFASQSLASGIPKNVIMEMLGHQDVRTTGIYLHPDKPSAEVLAQYSKFAGREAAPAAAPEVALEQPTALPQWLQDEITQRGLTGTERIFNAQELRSPTLRAAIQNDPALSAAQKESLLATGKLPPEPPGAAPAAPVSRPPTPPSPSTETPGRPILHEDRGPRRGDPLDIARQAANQAAVSGGSVHGLPPGVDPGPPDFAAHLMEAAHRMDMTVRSAANLPASVLGRYIEDVAHDHIVVSNISNQRVVTHEMGHGLDAQLFPDQYKIPLGRQNQQTLVDRFAPHGVTGISKGELFRQLASVSELMRGPLDTAYRRRASELIADYVSLYMHDPARARLMAPDPSRGFETALGKHPELQETMNQIHARNVVPVPGELPPGESSVIMQASDLPEHVGIKSEPLPPPHLLEVALAAQRYVKDGVRTLAAEEQRSRVWSNNAVKTIADADKRPKTLNPFERARREAEYAQARQDVGAFLEGTGNLRIQGDDIGSVRARMTPAMDKLVRDTRFAFEKQRERLNQYLKGLSEPEYIAYVKDYLPHFYVQNEQYGTSLSKFLKDSPNSKERTIPTLKQAREWGFMPISQDPAVLYPLYSRINWQVAMNRRLKAEIGKLRTPDGQEVVQPIGTAPANWIPLEKGSLFTKITGMKLPGLQEAQGKTLLWERNMAAHPDVYYAIRQVMDKPTSAIGRAYDQVNSFTRSAAFSLSGFHDISLAFASLGAQFRFSSPNPFRGLVRLFERDPVSGDLKFIQSAPNAGQKLLQVEGAVSDAAQHGLKFAWTDGREFEYNAQHAVDQTLQWASKLPGFKQYPPFIKALREMGKARQENLWSKTHDAMKILAYHDIVTKALEYAPDTIDTGKLKDTVASFLNDAFGGQDWQTHFWASPMTRRVWGRFMLAPDWTLSTIRSIPLASDVATALYTKTPRFSFRSGWPERVPMQGPVPGTYEGTRGNLMRLKFYGAELGALAMTTIAAQYAITSYFGDPEKGDHLWMWENEPGKNLLGSAKYTVDVTPFMRALTDQGIIKQAQHTPIVKHMVPSQEQDDYTRHYMNLGKRASEVLRWFLDPLSNIESKMSRPVAELAKQLTGRDGEFAAEWTQEGTSPFWTRATSVLKNAFPFTFTGNQFALSVPMRKGMTRYKAQDAFEALYEIAADPSAFMQVARSWSMGNPRMTAPTQGDLMSMFQQVSDAVERNGISAAEPLQQAKTAVMTRHLAAYSKAFVAHNNAIEAHNKGAEDDAEKEMEDQWAYIERLGFTGRGLRQSRKNQLKMHIQPTPADVTQPYTP